MRVIAGEWRGRRLKAPAGREVRPTLDRVREAWMSILQSDIPEARVLDLFAGSGALGIEALSRGAAAVHSVERDPRAVQILRENLSAVGAGDRAVVHPLDVWRFLERQSVPADLAFADPPYQSDDAARLVERWMERPFARVLSVEHRFGLPLPPGEDTRRYGDSAITFYRDR